MVTGVVDIGTSETRLLVAAAERGSAKVMLERRIPVASAEIGAAALASLILAEAGAANEAGAEQVIVTGSPHLKGTHLERGLDRRLRQAGLGQFRVLGPAEEAALTFIGASSIAPAAGGDVAVIRITEHSTQIAVGRPGSWPSWWSSRPLGSSRVARKTVPHDPPSPVDLAMMLDLARREVGNIHPPGCERAVVTGDGAYAAVVACDGTVTADSLSLARKRAAFGHSEVLSAQLGIEPGRARELPVVLTILQAVLELIGRPITAVHAGKLEGLIIARGEGIELSRSLRWVVT